MPGRRSSGVTRFAIHVRRASIATSGAITTAMITAATAPWPMATNIRDGGPTARRVACSATYLAEAISSDPRGRRIWQSAAGEEPAALFFAVPPADRGTIVPNVEP